MNKQLVKFLLVGGLNTLFGYAVFAVLISTGLHYTIAVFIGTLIGVLFNFKTTGKLVFDSQDNTLIWKFFAKTTFMVSLITINHFIFYIGL